MTIVSRTMYPIQTSFSQISQMQSRFAKLQVQLATGQRASNLAELGSDRYFDLSIRSRIGRIDGYQSNVDTVNLRLSMLNKSLSTLSTIQASARTALTPSAYGTSGVNFATAPSLAGAQLDQTLNLLNTDAAGRYLFGGSTSDKPPVAETDAILNGAGGKAGFKQVVSERTAADLGDGLGRLTLGGTGNTVSLTEDGAHPFGFKLSSLTTTSGAAALTQHLGTAPQSEDVTFNSLPIAGETVTLGLTLPDGSSASISLKAVTGTPGAAEFQIGADPATTASNFSAALGSSLTDMGKTTLASASAFAAADNFFNAQGTQVMRVAGGPNFATATSLVAADPSNTVIWYQGSDSADSRSTVTSKVDDNTNVSYGVQANETGILQLVRSLAAVAVQSFPSADPTSQGRFDAAAERNLSRLSDSHDSDSGSLAVIAVQLGNTQATMQDIKTRNTSYSDQLSTMLGNIESMPDEEVAAEMLALQTRLTASYQATSMISQLSLVNFLK